MANTEVTSTATSPQKAIASKKRKQHFSGVSSIFPSDLYPGKSMCLYFYDYEKITQLEPGTFAPDKGIFLPIPSNLVDSLALSYRDVELGSLGGELYGFVQDAASSLGNIDFTSEKSIEAGLSSLRNSASNTLSQPGAVQAFLRRNIKEVGAPGEFISRAADLVTKSIPNPHLTSLFGGVGLRSHNFSWRFAPRSAEETVTLKNIIKDIKLNSLPEKKNNFFLSFPKIVKIFIFINGTEYRELFQFKPAVVESIDVNYSTQGSPAFFADTGGPVEIDVSLRLKEIQIFTKEDISSTDNGTWSNYIYPSDMDVT